MSQLEEIIQNSRDQMIEIKIRVRENLKSNSTTTNQESTNNVLLAENREIQEEITV